MTLAIVLAGGRATRLGPLTAQLNKALVSVGQRPMIAHQLEAFRRADVDAVVIVTSPSSSQQVADVVERSHADIGLDIYVTEQAHPHGPGDAVGVGAQYLISKGLDGPVYVIMADTFIDEPLPDISCNWIGVAPAPATRSWCYPDGTTYVEGECKEGTPVCIGVYGFSNVHGVVNAAVMAAADSIDEDEVPMAPLLNAIERPRNVELTSWLDVGDVRALARARRKRFITRDFNSLELTDQGVIIKRGEHDKIMREAKYYMDLTKEESLLFPRFLHNAGDGFGYRIEFVDLPSLAELYLYWPGRPDMWADILAGITERLRRDLWGIPEVNEDFAVAWHNEMYSHKVYERLGEWEAAGNTVDWITVDKIGGFLAGGPPSKMVRGHGDLNFGNILYSLGSDVIKLVDPRGDTLVDLDYELAKLRYSYRDGFSAICHNLFSIADGDVRFGPQREAEAEAMDGVLSNLSDLRRIAAVESTLFLSAVPLHRGDQQLALYRQGIKLAKEVLDHSAWIKHDDDDGEKPA